MNYFNNDGHLNDLGISLYADAIKLHKVKELPESFKIHVDSCATCQHQLVDFSAVMMDIKQDTSAAHPYFDKKQEALPTQKETVEKKGSHLRSSIYRLAVAAILGALILYGYKQFTKPATNEVVEIPKEKIQPTEQIKPTEIIPEPEQPVVNNEVPKEKQPFITPNSPKSEVPKEINNRALLAANYVPNEDFEALIETTFRSTAFKVKFPKNDAVFVEGANIIFNWENNIPLTLVILDNQEEEQFKQTLSINTFDFKTNLKPGIYYWKLETEEDLLHLGKFEID